MCLVGSAARPISRAHTTVLEESTGPSVVHLWIDLCVRGGVVREQLLHWTRSDGAPARRWSGDFSSVVQRGSARVF